MESSHNASHVNMTYLPLVYLIHLADHHQDSSPHKYFPWMFYSILCFSLRYMTSFPTCYQSILGPTPTKVPKELNGATPIEVVCLSALSKDQTNTYTHLGIKSSDPCTISSLKYSPYPL